MRIITIILAVGLANFLNGCGGGTGTKITCGVPCEGTPPAAPTVSTTAAQNGAVIVSLASTTTDAIIFYTVDGSTPTSSSQQYQAPFLVASNLTVNAIAAAGALTSTVTSQPYSPNIPSNTLVWSDEFTNSTGTQAEPDPAVWTYDTGTDCCGNNELETYCAWGSNTSPCSTANPNAFIDTNGYLNIVGLNPSANVYTSARLKTQGLLSFMYGRIEAKIQLPESQGMWPAFWMLGNNIATINWPACGETDVMEHIDGATPPLYQGGPIPGYDWIAGSVHGGTSGNEINGSQAYPSTSSGFSAADWHTYGMIWSKGQIQYYVDDYTAPYVTFTPTNSNFNSSTWPFDQGPQFIILNLAIGGDWPGSPDSTTVFPAPMLVDYVRIYTN